MRPYLPSKALQATPEVRAFIYQQINEFEGFLPSGSSVGVLLHEAHDHIVATIEVHSVAGNLQCHGVGSDPIEALVDAKNIMLYQLEALREAQAHEKERAEEPLKPMRVHRYRH
ncbi:MAG TPA: hypothetical protein VFV50_09940 [Bdellovibrionales bacterium]|nr:hypothetical protein [Bdellovibrionales bacterium]